jgi:hypothetical protein
LRTEQPKAEAHMTEAVVGKLSESLAADALVFSAWFGELG